MKFLIILFLAFLSHAKSKDPKFMHRAKSFVALTQKAADHKDIPATCWYVGAMQAWSQESRDAKEARGEEFHKLVTSGTGRCAGNPKSQDLAAAYNEAEWTRITLWLNEVDKF